MENYLQLIEQYILATVHLVFNSANENYLAVASYEECQVLTVNSRDEITDRLAIELALQGAYIHISIQITFPLLS